MFRNTLFCLQVLVLAQFQMIDFHSILVCSCETLHKL